MLSRDHDWRDIVQALCEHGEDYDDFKNIALVKYKKLVGGGLLKIVNRTVPMALQKLGYEQEQIDDIVAYVDDQDAETISEQRGGFGQPGVESPFRQRSPEENLGLFRQMRDGAFADGTKVRICKRTGAELDG